MSLSSFINHISAGKIRLKYRVVVRRWSKTQYFLLHFLAIGSFFTALFWGAYVSSRNMFVFAYIPPMVFLIGTGELINRWAGKLRAIGELSFSEEYCTISGEQEYIVPYSSITEINFKIDVNGIYASKIQASPHSYTLQIITGTNSYVLHVERKLLLTDEDLNQFSRGYPDLIWTLNELQKIYRFRLIERNRKFQLPFTSED